MNFADILARPAAFDSANTTATLAARLHRQSGSKADIRTQAQDFEANVLSTMFQSMFSGVGEEGPMGNSPGVGVWRSFLTDEYAKNFAKAGGIGLADQVYSTLIAQQEARAPKVSSAAVSP